MVREERALLGFLRDSTDECAPFWKGVRATMVRFYFDTKKERQLYIAEILRLIGRLQYEKKLVRSVKYRVLFLPDPGTNMDDAPLPLRLSKAQRIALRRLRSGWQTRTELKALPATLNALVDKKLANRSFQGESGNLRPGNVWRITPAGTEKARTLRTAL